MQLLPAGIRHDRAGKSGHTLELDAVRHGHRLAIARQQHEEPARAHAAHAEHPAGHRIHTAEIVQQPRVRAGLFQRRPESASVEARQRRHS